MVFAGSAQLAFVNLVKEGAGGPANFLTVLLSLRHVLYGLSVNAHLPAQTRPPRPVLAATITDESYGLSIRTFLSGRGSEGFFALAAPGFGGSDDELLPRLAAAGAATVVVLRSRRPRACLVVGITVFWAMRAGT